MEQLSDLRALVKSRGWDRLRSLAEAQCKTRQARINAPLDSGNPYPQEFMKGEIAGIELFMRLPEISIEELQKELDDGDDDVTEET